MPATSHYKAKGKPTLRKAITALKKAIGRKGRGVTTMPYLGSGRRGQRRGGLSWKQMEDAFNSIPAALKAIPSFGAIPNSAITDKPFWILH